MPGDANGDGAPEWDEEPEGLREVFPVFWPDIVARYLPRIKLLGRGVEKAKAKLTIRELVVKKL